MDKPTPGARIKARRKMYIRIDDVGHSPVYNMGSFAAIDHGLVGAADIMLDSPGTQDALERMRKYPWIAVGWHGHMWGKPVLGARAVPSLVEKGGEFDGRFRLDLQKTDDIVFDEAVRELRAQLALCVRILGKLPDTSGGGNMATVWGRAVRQIVDEARIAHDFSSTLPSAPAYTRRVSEAQARGEEWAKTYKASWPFLPCDPQWAGRKIVTAGNSAFTDLLTDSVASVEKAYDPVLFYTQDPMGILDRPADEIFWQYWQPGYIDYYTYRLGERANRARAQQFVVGRTQDVAALSDRRLRDWIKANGIALINTRDALHGTHEFQNHLSAIGSDLAMA